MAASGVLLANALIRRAWQEGGELSGMVEFKRHFPLISERANVHA